MIFNHTTLITAITAFQVIAIGILWLLIYRVK